MIEAIKNKLWDLLKKKEVSLALLYNREGEIIWSRGRPVIGKNIKEGAGFSKTFLKKAIEQSDTIEEENVIVQTEADKLPKSARILNIKSLLIQPVSENYFLYIDSGSKESFTQTDNEVIKSLGWIMGEMIEQIKTSETEAGGITGSSPDISLIRDKVIKYALEEEPILLLGETGVGKSHIAELIHRYSGRKGRFFTINVPSIPENIFESELFGHKRGAFTDARTDKIGYVDEVKGGTIFFDEVSEIPYSFQAKLLRFIETKRYIKLGETREKYADVRILAATNRNLQRAIDKKEFREDLYYRLQVLEVEIPPLRTRKEDIKDLIGEHLHLLKGKKIGAGFWDVMKSHLWPGNVRELKTVLTRGGILLNEPISGDDIAGIINQSGYKKAIKSQQTQVDEVWRKIIKGKSFWKVVREPFLHRQLNCFEVRSIIEKGLAQCSGSYKELVKVLNIKESDYKKFLNFLRTHKIMNDSNCK